MLALPIPSILRPLSPPSPSQLHVRRARFIAGSFTLLISPTFIGVSPALARRVFDSFEILAAPPSKRDQALARPLFAGPRTAWHLDRLGIDMELPTEMLCNIDNDQVCAHATSQYPFLLVSLLSLSPYSLPATILLLFLSPLLLLSHTQMSGFMLLTGEGKWAMSAQLVCIQGMPGTGALMVNTIKQQAAMQHSTDAEVIRCVSSLSWVLCLYAVFYCGASMLTHFHASSRSSRVSRGRVLSAWVSATPLARSTGATKTPIRGCSCCSHRPGASSP